MNIFINGISVNWFYWCLLLAVLALSGCKVKIAVPEGGSVESSTGLYGCAEQETCTIDVDHVYLSETFRAVAKPGYKFREWERGDGSFCGGQKNPRCNLATVGFDDYPSLNELLGSDSVFTLTPVFVYEQTSKIPPPSKPVWKVNSNHSTQNYIIDGRTADELKAAMQGPSNPREMSHETGGKLEGSASVSLIYTYWYRTSANETVCTISRGELDLEFHTIMPVLFEPETKTNFIQTKWIAYKKGFQDHLAAHQEIFRESPAAASQALGSIVSAPCNELANQVREATDSAWMPVKQRSDDYNVETDHGRYTIPSLY